ncbi:hypothetical protein [Rickettsiella grylli]|nr:hypothetical protein [Rickettsiella grylli]
MLYLLVFIGKIQRVDTLVTNAFTVEKMEKAGLSANLKGKTDFDIFTQEVARNYREIDRKVIDERTTLKFSLLIVNNI